MTTRPTARSFLPEESFETSSSGPGCLYIEMKRTKMAIGQKSSITKSRIDNAVKTVLAFSPNKERATWPPSSIAAGSRLSIVTIIPTHPAKATG